MIFPGSIGQGALVALLFLQQSAPGDGGPKQSPGVEHSGSIAGIIKFKGEIPKFPVPDDAGVRRDVIEVDRATGGLRDVVVSIVPLNRLEAHAPTPQPGHNSVKMDQREYAFMPKVLAVSEGQPVVFTNSDPANHNVRTASPLKSNEFNIYISEGSKHEHRFAAQTRPIRVGCDIHPWMRGWIYVFDHPHFAVTDEHGEFRIGLVQPGDYSLLIQQPDIRFQKEQRINVTPDQTARVQIEVQPDSAAQPKE